MNQKFRGYVEEKIDSVTTNTSSHPTLERKIQELFGVSAFRSSFRNEDFSNERGKACINEQFACREGIRSHLALAKSPRILFGAVLIAGVLLQSQGYCDDVQSIDNLTTNVIQTIFSPWVRKTALAFGGGFGLFQAYSAGSFKPLLTWGGLGLAVSYIPKLVEVIAKIGT